MGVAILGLLAGEDQALLVGGMPSWVASRSRCGHLRAARRRRRVIAGREDALLVLGLSLGVADGVRGLHLESGETSSPGAFLVGADGLSRWKVLYRLVKQFLPPSPSTKWHSPDR